MSGLWFLDFEAHEKNIGKTTGFVIARLKSEIFKYYFNKKFSLMNMNIPNLKLLEIKNIKIVLAQARV